MIITKRLNWLIGSAMTSILQRSAKTATKFAIISVCFLPLTMVPLYSASAQTSEVQVLLDRINRLEADLNNVQRKVFQGQNVPAPKISSGGGTVVGGSEAAALLSSRLDSLEEEQRNATGATEEITFKLDQLSSRLNKLVLDVDFRLTEIERRINGGALSESPANINEAPTEDQTKISVTNPSRATSQANDLPKGTQLLGTIRAPSGTDTSSIATSEQVASTNEASSAPLNPEDQYNRAISLIRKDDYGGAERAFSQFLESNKDHTLSGNAQYWLGETFYVRGDYPNAASAFLKGYQEYPKSSKAADNLLKLAMTLGRMDQREEACVTFQQMDKQFTKLPPRLKRISNREKKKFECP